MTEVSYDFYFFLKLIFVWEVWFGLSINRLYSFPDLKT